MIIIPGSIVPPVESSATSDGGRARALLRERGARVTHPRVRVLAALLGAGEALSHLDLQRRLEVSVDSEPIDRVTLLVFGGGRGGPRRRSRGAARPLQG